MSKPNSRDRRTIQRRRDLDQHSGPYRLEDLPELQQGAALVLDSWYDETSVYLAWKELESEKEWRARVKKLDAAAARRAKNPRPRLSKEQRLLEQARQKLTPEELAALEQSFKNN